MMLTEAISPAVGGTSATGTSGPRSSQGSTAQVARDEFLRLLVTQLQHQDPLDPMKGADFTAQLAQLSALDNFEKLNSRFAEMLTLQELNQGSSLIGKQITFARAGSSNLDRGVVEAVKVVDSKVQLVVGNNLVPLDQIRGIEPPPVRAS